MNPQDGGCTNLWCLDYRTRVAHRADLAERAVRGLTGENRALRAEISRLKEPPDEQDRKMAKYHEFKAKAWILLAVILIVLGGGLITLVLAAEHLIETTKFIE